MFSDMRDNDNFRLMEALSILRRINCELEKFTKAYNSYDKNHFDHNDISRFKDELIDRISTITNKALKEI